MPFDHPIVFLLLHTHFPFWSIELFGQLLCSWLYNRKRGPKRRCQPLWERSAAATCCMIDANEDWKDFCFKIGSLKLESTLNSILFLHHIDNYCNNTRKVITTFSLITQDPFSKHLIWTQWDKEMGYGRKFRKPTLETVNRLAHKSFSSLMREERDLYLFMELMKHELC